MNDLSIRELLEGASELLDKRSAALARLPTGSYFKAAIAEKVTLLRALPESLATLPLAELLKLLDKNYDQWGRCIHYLLRAAEECPTMPTTHEDAVALVRGRYMTGLKELLEPYGVEAQRGRERSDLAVADEAVLRTIATPDGRNLFDWVSAYATAGKAIGGGLTGRADELSSAGDAPRAGVLRSETIGLFGELRAAIRLQLKAQPDLPRTLEADILGNFDELQRLAAQRRKKAPAAEQPKPE